MSGEILWAWAAGIIDGEGCFQLAKGRNRQVLPVLVIKMTHEETVLRLKQILKAGSVYPVPAPKKGQKSSFALQINGKDIFEITSKLLPYLFTKRLQAELMIEYGEKCWTPVGVYGGFGRGRVPVDLQALREVLQEEMAVLNQRGDGL